MQAAATDMIEDGRIYRAREGKEKAVLSSRSSGDGDGAPMPA